MLVSRLIATEELDEATKPPDVPGRASMPLEAHKRIIEFQSRLHQIEEQTSKSVPPLVEALSASDLAAKLTQIKQWAVSLQAQQKEEVERARALGLLN